jgi:hypothetical protein
VAQNVSHLIPISVLVLREDEPDLIPAASAGPLCALVTLDGSSLAEKALTPVANLVAGLAVPAQGALHLNQIVKPIATAEGGERVDELN